MTVRLAVIGAGGHARVVADIVLSISTLAPGSIELAGFIAPAGHGWLDIPVLGDDTALPAFVSEGRITHFILGVGTVRGGNHLREQLAESAIAAGACPFTAIHPSAVVGRDVVVASGTAIMAMAVIGPGAQVSSHAIINTGAVIDHDCVIEAFAHIAPGAVLAGDVRVGRNAMIGVGASARQGVRVGGGATVGAGAVIVKDIDAGVTASGCPARPYAAKR